MTYADITQTPVELLLSIELFPDPYLRKAPVILRLVIPASSAHGVADAPVTLTDADGNEIARGSCQLKPTEPKQPDAEEPVIVDGTHDF